MNKEISSIQENNSELRGKENELFSDVCRIIDGARDRIATHLNTELCLTNWYIGHRIKEDVLYNQRAEYGKQVVKNLAKLLTGRYGSGWKYEKLKQCIRVAYAFSEEEIRYALRTQLTWTHLRSLTGVKEPLARRFYVEMCRIEHWDTRTLDEKIDGQLFERTAISRKPEEVIKRELEQVKTTFCSFTEGFVGWLQLTLNLESSSRNMRGRCCYTCAISTRMREGRAKSLL